MLRIISGGQTGADQGGLLAARELSIPSGGTAPKEWWTETGSDEQLLRSFGLVECSEPGYEARTRKNVLDSDGTLLVGSYATGGSAMTAKIANEAGKPFFHECSEQDAQRNRRRSNDKFQNLKPDNFVNQRGAATANKQQNEKRQVPLLL